jgi:peptidoglycan/LPS O-acetylase OafA/YrhL
MAHGAARADGGHLDALTGIRGVAAWMVVLYHVRLSLTDLLPGWSIAAMAKGYLAVDLFFMLSGFVLWYNYADKLRREGIPGAGRFLWRRVARVWPLHLFVLAVFVLFATALVFNGRSSADYPFSELPLHVFLMQCWGLTPQLAWNNPAWSISTEFAAYLLFPFLVWALHWERRASALLLGAAALLLGALFALFAANGFDNLGAEISRFGVWRCLLEFATGNLLCVLWQRCRAARLAGPGAALAAIAALGTGLGLGLPETAFVPLCFACGLLALALDRGTVAKALGRGVVLYLGEISYSTYLAHFLLFILFKLAFVDASLQIGWAGLCGFLALVLAASVILYHGIEKPAQRWLNRRQPRVAHMDAVAAE